MYQRFLNAFLTVKKRCPLRNMKTVKGGKQFPVIVTEGGVSAKIRKTTQTKNGKDYVVYIIDYILLGKRKQVGRTSFDEAKQHALEACRSIAHGRQDSLTLINQARLVYLRAIETLSPAGFQLDVAATEYAAAMQILGGILPSRKPAGHG
jgi:hypothetical protein